MALTNDRRDELILDIHADVRHIKSQLAEHHHSLYGADGNDGLSSRMQAVEIGQRDCPARKSASIEGRWTRISLWIAGISAMCSVAATIVAIFALVVK